MNSAYSQAPAAGFSERNTYSGGAQSDTSNGTPTAKRSSKRAFKTVFCTMRQSSGTFESLSPADAPQRIAEWLTLLPQDSHANRSVSPENGAAPTTSATCGPQRSSASAWYDRDSRCWKTCQGLLPLITSEPSLQTWPRAGLMSDGVVYPQDHWAHRTLEIGYGYLPTPQMSDGLFRDIRRSVRLHGMCYRIESNNGVDGNAKLADIAWGVFGGPLHPELSGSMMGWPPRWTDLEPLETDKFQQWLQQHGVYSQGICK